MVNAEMCRPGAEVSRLLTQVGLLRGSSVKPVLQALG